MLERYLASQGTAGSAIFAVAGFLATAFLAGWGVLGRRLNLRPHETFFLSITLGIDLVVLLATPFLWLGWLPNSMVRIVFAAALAGMGVLLVLRLRASRVSGGWVGVPWHLTPILLLGVLLFKNALSYPFAYDDLTYQIAVPERWLKANSLEVFRDNPFSAFAGVNLIGNLVLLKAGGLHGPMLFNYALGLILAMAVVFLVRERTGPWTATIFSLSFVMSPSFLMVSMSAYAEPWILLQVTGLLFLIGCRGRGLSTDPGHRCHRCWEFLLMGFFAGVAACVKLTGIIVPVAVGVYLAATRNHKRRQLVWFLGPLLVVLAVFYARPFLATGNPVYPYFAEYFTTDEATLAMSAYHHDAGKLHFGPPMKGFWQTTMFFLETPLLLCLGPFASSLKVYDGGFGAQGIVHLLLVGGLLLSAYQRRFRGQKLGKPKTYDEKAFAYLGATLLLYAFWFFTAQQARFLLPGYLCVILAGSCASSMLNGPGGKILLTALIVATAVVPVDIVKHVGNSWHAHPLDLVYSATQDEYLKACQLVAGTPKDAKILLLYEQRGLYIPRDYVIGTPYFQERFFTPPDNIDSEFLDVLRGAGITHVLVGAAGVNDPDRMDKYMALAEPVRQCLFRLKSHGLEEKATVTTKSSVGDQVQYVLYAVVAERARSQ